MINPFFLLMLGVLTSMLVIPVAWKLAPYLKMLDMPDARKVHSLPIPRIGGWGIVAGSLLPVVLSNSLNPLLESFVIGAVILFVFGAWDDARQVSHWVKFVGQIAAALTVVSYGNLYVTDWPFVGDAFSETTSRILTGVALMGMINAINHSDGLDGLAGGESILSLTSIAFLGYLASSDLTTALAFTVIGGILGFLRYNTHPAEVFMGDAGSQFLGFSLGFLAIYLTQVASTAISPALPLLFLGLPISDILVVLYKRIKGKMNWFKATRNHVHHRLLDLGFSHAETVIVIYSVQALLVTFSVPMRYQSDLVVSLLYLVVVCGLFTALWIAEQKGWRRSPATGLALDKIVSGIRTHQNIKRIPILIITFLLPIFITAGAVLSRTVPRDLAVIAGVLVAIRFLEVLLGRDRDSLTTRLSVYFAAVSSSYLFVHASASGDLISQTAGTCAIVVLAIAIALFIRYTSEHRFGATPTDYLIAFGMVVLVIFGGIDGRSHEAINTLMYTVVLLYGCESLFGAPRPQWLLLRLATLLSLVILAARGTLFLG